MYSVESIVLRRNDFRHNKSVLTLFSRDFGRFDCFYTHASSSPKVDIGTHIRAYVTTKNDRSSLRSLLGIRHIATDDWGYMEYECFLWLITLAYRLLPTGNPYGSLFDDMKRLYIQPDARHHVMSQISYLTLRLIVIFGIQIFDMADESLTNILTHIRNTPYDKMKNDISALDPLFVRTYAQQCTERFFSGA